MRWLSILSGKVVLLYLILPVLIITETHRAQTVIREKVTLTPQNQLRNIQKVQDHETWWPCSPPSKTYDLYNPRQAVWMYSTFPLNPGRQDLRSIFGYGIDTSKYYTFTIVSGGQYFHFQRNYYNGYNWDTDIFHNSITVKGKELWPKSWDEDKGMFETIYDSIKCIDYDFAPFYISCYSYEYTIHFNDIWSREEEVVYSVETDGLFFYVHTFIKRPTYTLSTDSPNDTLLYGLTRRIPIILKVNECKNDTLLSGYRNGSNLNDEVEFSVRITEGAEYGNLFINNYNFGDEAVVDYYTLGNHFYLIAKDGENPDSVASMKIEITCNAPYVTPNTVSSEFIIKHNSNPLPGLLMTFDKNVLMPFDSTRIYLQFVTDEGEIYDFHPFYNFNLWLEEGSDYGELYTEIYDYGSTDLYNVGAEGLWFYSTQDIPINMVDVVIHAEESGSIIAGRINPGYTIKNNQVTQLKNSNNSLKRTQSTQQVDKLETKGELQIAGPILLGETRYLGVQKKEDNTAYRIEEIPNTVYGVKPDFPADVGGWKWIKKSSVWSDDPISSSGKSGIYWEKKYYEKSTDTNKTLDDGMIRVIGRYWEEGKEENYKVTLKAQLDNKVIEREIKVVKPSKLGSDYHTGKDVFNNSINIDDICIETGGKNGIPPQIIKGQMQKETDFSNAYRYEPFQDIYYQGIPAKRKELFEDYDYFTITSTSMGSVSIPSTHTNVSPISYPNEHKKIKSFVVDNIWKYIQKPSDKNDNKPIVVGNSNGDLTTKLQEAYESYKKKKKPLTLAVDSLKKYINSDKYKDGDKYAQTRIIASYGMLQQTYYDAATGKETLAGFKLSNSSQPPEFLNEKDYSLKSYTERIGRRTKNRAGNNWNEGYEKGWEKILDNYNHYEANYEKDVLNNSKSFLPVK